jgi:diadenosine tetraphosphate (Ap4A) HIT family hydrolase
MQLLQILLANSISSPFILRIHARTLAQNTELSETRQQCLMQLMQLMQVAVKSWIKTTLSHEKAFNPVIA